MRQKAVIFGQRKSKTLKRIALTLIVSISGHGLYADSINFMPSVSILQMENSNNTGDKNANAAYFVGVSEAVTLFIGQEMETLGTGLFFCPPSEVVLNGSMMEIAFYQGQRGANPTNYAIFDILNGLRQMFPCN